MTISNATLGQGVVFIAGAYAPATTANLATSNNALVGLMVDPTQVAGHQVVTSSGFVPLTSVPSLGVGAASDVGLDANGFPVRGPGATGLIIGKCDTLGNLILSGAGGGSSSGSTLSLSTVVHGVAVAGKAALSYTASGTAQPYSIAAKNAGYQIIGIFLTGGSNTSVEYAPLNAVVAASLTGLSIGALKSGVVGIDGSGALYALEMGRNGDEMGTFDSAGNTTVRPHTAITNSSRSTVNLEMFGGRPMSSTSDTAGALVNIVAWNAAQVLTASTSGQGIHIEVADRYYIAYTPYTQRPHHYTGLAAGGAGNGKGELYFPRNGGGVTIGGFSINPAGAGCPGTKFTNVDFLTLNAGSYADVSTWRPNTAYAKGAYVRRPGQQVAPGQLAYETHVVWRAANAGTSGASFPASMTSSPGLHYPMQWSPGLQVHVGDVVIASRFSTAYGNKNAAKVTAISGGTSAFTRTDGTEPFTSGNMTVSATVADGDAGQITWTIYNMCDQTLDPNYPAVREQYYKTPPDAGRDATDPYFYDNGIDWIPELHNAINNFENSVGVEHCSMYGFQGIGRLDYGRGGFSPESNANFCWMTDCVVTQCTGAYAAADGDNENGIYLLGVKCELPGQRGDSGSYGAGCGFLNRSLGVHHMRCYSEGGPVAFWSESGNSVFDNCTSEASQNSYITTGVIRGGSILQNTGASGASTVITGTPNVNANINARDFTHPFSIMSMLDMQDGAHVNAITCDAELVNGFVPASFIATAYGVEAAGQYSRCYTSGGSDTSSDCIGGALAADESGNLEGPGHLWTLRGRYEGQLSNRVYTGVESSEYSGGAVARRLAGGRRSAGSTFRTNPAPAVGAYRNTNVVVGGNSATATRTINTSMTNTDVPCGGGFGDIITPGDGQAWLLTRGGTTSGTATGTLFPSTPTKTTPGNRAQVWYAVNAGTLQPYVLDQLLRPTTNNGHYYKVTTKTPTSFPQSAANLYTVGMSVVVGTIVKGNAHTNANMVFVVESINGQTDPGYAGPSGTTITTAENSWGGATAGSTWTDGAGGTIVFRALVIAWGSKAWQAWTIVQPTNVIRVESMKRVFQCAVQTFFNGGGGGGNGVVGMVVPSVSAPNANCVFKCLSINGSSKPYTNGPTGNEPAWGSAKPGDIFNNGTSTWIAIALHTLATIPAFTTRKISNNAFSQFLVPEGNLGLLWEVFPLYGMTTEPPSWATGAGSETADPTIPQFVYVESGALVAATSLQLDNTAEWTLLGPVTNATSEGVSDFVDDKYVHYVPQQCVVRGMDSADAVAANTATIDLWTAKRSVSSNALTPVAGNSNTTFALGTLPNNAKRLVPQFPAFVAWKAVGQITLGRTDVGAVANGLVYITITQYGHTDGGANAVLDGAAVVVVTTLGGAIAGATASFAVPSGYLELNVNPTDAVGGHTYSATGRLTIEFGGTYS